MSFFTTAIGWINWHSISRERLCLKFHLGPYASSFHLFETQRQDAIRRPIFHELLGEQQGAGPRGAVVIEIKNWHPGQPQLVDGALPRCGIACFERTLSKRAPFLRPVYRKRSPRRPARPARRRRRSPGGQPPRPPSPVPDSPPPFPVCGTAKRRFYCQPLPIFERKFTFVMPTPTTNTRPIFKLVAHAKRRNWRTETETITSAEL